MRFGELLRLSRQNSDRSITQICDYMKWRTPHLMDYEHSRTKPPELIQLTKLADFLNVPNKKEFINLGVQERGSLDLKFPTIDEMYIDLGLAIARSKTLTSEQLKKIKEVLDNNSIDCILLSFDNDDYIEEYISYISSICNMYFLFSKIIAT